MNTIKLKNLTNEDYHAHPALSWSKFKHFLESPFHYQQNVILKSEVASSDSLRFGTLVHASILEPDLLFNSYAIMPDFGDLRVSRNKQAKSEWLESHKDVKFQITSDEWMRLHNITHNFAKLKLDLKDLFVEQSLFSSYQGLEIKAKPDAFNFDLVLDIKTSVESLNAFKYTINKYQYQYQLSFYDLVLVLNDYENKNREFKILYVQSKDECEVAMIRINPVKVFDKQEYLIQKLKEFYYCKNENDWPMRGQLGEIYVDPY